ncbi:basic proline-rich protein-like [Chroicocephalus ridibundus]|uniref:basic proline-rich protein-like n=1 Tax=Chroicocephalus ridibundus TaxID=1192867 RepID=UPI002FDDF9A4
MRRQLPARIKLSKKEVSQPGSEGTQGRQALRGRRYPTAVQPRPPRKTATRHPASTCPHRDRLSHLTPPTPCPRRLPPHPGEKAGGLQRHRRGAARGKSLEPAASGEPEAASGASRRSPGRGWGRRGVGLPRRAGPARPPEAIPARPALPPPRRAPPRLRRHPLHSRTGSRRLPPPLASLPPPPGPAAATPPPPQRPPHSRPGRASGASDWAGATLVADVW